MQKHICLLLTTFLILLTGCDQKSIKGSGTIESKTMELTEFHTLEVSGNFIVNVTGNNKFALEITADKNLLDYIDVTNNSNKLQISNKKSVNLNPSKNIEISIGGNYVEKVTLAGAISLQINNLQSDKIELELAGASDLKANNIQTKDLKLTAAGSTSATLNGRSDVVAYEISGSSDLLSKDLIANKVDLFAAGSSNVEVFAQKSLKIDASGSSDIKYFGKPKDIKSNIAGYGKVNEGSY